jgi:hypothetical protein
MVSESNSPRFIEQADLTPVEGRVNSQNLDGISSNSLKSGAIKSKGRKGKGQVPSPETRGPGPSPSGNGDKEKGDNEGNRVVQLPRASSNNPFKDSDNILQAIADRFVDARKHQKVAAWRQLQIDLMHASAFICPVMIPYKDLISIVSDIEKEIKGATEQVGKSNEEIMASYLSGEGSLVVVEMDIGPDMKRDRSLDKKVDKSAMISTSGGDDGPVKDTPLSADPSSQPSSPSSS